MNYLSVVRRFFVALADLLNIILIVSVQRVVTTAIPKINNQ